MVTKAIKTKFWKLMNVYYEPIGKRWNLSDKEKLQIAKYIKHNKEKIEPYFGTINKNDIDRVLDSIEQFARLKKLSIDLSTISQYFDMLENLDKIIEEIKKGFFNSLPKYNNVVKPNNPNNLKNYYMEIAFGIDGNPEKRKKTLIDILKNLIGNVGARGYPISYYNGTDIFPIQYYMEFYPDRTSIRIFIDRSSIPPDIVGYLLYELNNIEGKESIIPPSGNTNYYIINNKLGIIDNRIGIDIDPSQDPYASRALFQYSLLYKFFYGRRNSRKITKTP
jgi:hypothetical protein